MALAAIAARDRGTDRERRAAADDRIGAEHAARDVGDVHRAALAVAQSVLAAVDLLHHAGHVATLGDAVTVAAVRADDVVGIAERFADADRNGLLPGVQVSEARDLAGLDFDVQAFLEFADRLHLPVRAQQGVRGQGHGMPPAS